MNERRSSFTLLGSITKRQWTLIFLAIFLLLFFFFVLPISIPLVLALITALIFNLLFRFIYNKINTVRQTNIIIVIFLFLFFCIVSSDFTIRKLILLDR